MTTANKLPVVQKNIQKAYKRLLSWEKVGQEFGVTKGTAYRIAHGYEPKNVRIRAALHLPAFAPAPVCVHCGQVHVSKRCTMPRRLPEPWESATLFLEARMKERH